MVLPSYLREFPVAIIHYRWSGKTTRIGALSVPMFWPHPMSDISFAYSWLARYLKPPGGKYRRRDFYVYGTKLGAGLAMSLALISCRPHVPVGIRGVAAWDGIYDWTRFLPDHWDNRFSDHDDVNNSQRKAKWKYMTAIALLKKRMPALFSNPGNLFDAYASPVMFFSTSGLIVPETFHKTVYQQYEDKYMPLPASHEEEAMERLRREHDELYGFLDVSYEEERHALHPDPAHHSHMLRRLAAGSPPADPVNLNFPPQESLLEIPETLMIYTSPPEELDLEPIEAPPSDHTGRLTPCDVDPREVVFGPKPAPKKKPPRYRAPIAMPNTFKSHAIILGNFMVRSINEFEVKQREKWREPPEDFEEYLERAQYRVIAADAGPAESNDLAMPAQGQGLLLNWLRPRLLGMEIQNNTELLERSELEKVGPYAEEWEDEIADLIDGGFSEQPDFSEVKGQLEKVSDQAQDYLDNGDDRIELPTETIDEIQEVSSEGLEEDFFSEEGSEGSEEIHENLSGTRAKQEGSAIGSAVADEQAHVSQDHRPVEAQTPPDLEKNDVTRLQAEQTLSSDPQASLDMDLSLSDDSYNVPLEVEFDILQSLHEQERQERDLVNDDTEVPINTLVSAFERLYDDKEQQHQSPKQHPHRRKPSKLRNAQSKHKK
ncbi:hypothetical protein CFIMG_002440RA [Ceratocystis fimbriata CBS 114723]|uniref:Alpha/beta hydrolase fold-3 domain-containing protein n=1 Tax=Ceratocystis fimbriata CBS 114723 TaxID=1035309 RepID=A0A2C5X9J9_9PEZI|nr:hypothetical protein CFIMG_002440RA [Ceratocystis fimbriata CBS 114723]